MCFGAIARSRVCVIDVWFVGVAFVLVCVDWLLLVCLTNNVYSWLIGYLFVCMLTRLFGCAFACVCVLSVVFVCVG